MGSGGMSSRLSRGNQSYATVQGGRVVTVNPATQPQPQQQQNIQNQTPNAQNTPVKNQALQQLTQMSDAQLAALAKQSKNIQLPNNLADRPDPTQNFAFAAGLNEKPVVLDDKSFDQFMKDNGMTKADILSRDVNPVSFTANGHHFNYTADDVINMMKYSRLNYIGGKVGGQAYGAGTYFDHTNGNSTGYGYGNSKTAIAVLNPATANVINYNTLHNQAAQFARSHPQFAKQVGQPQSGRGGNLSIYALAMGYNAISSNGGGGANGGNGYINVIDRSALIYRQSNK